VLTVAKNKSIEDALNDILNQKKLDEIVQETVKEAGIKAQKDLVKETKKIIQHYYDAYSERKFEPNYSLYRSYTYENLTRGKTINVNVNFDASRLDGLYTSYSKYHQSGAPWEAIEWKKGYGAEPNKQYGAVESDFIFDHFWKGLHPVTLGNKWTGFIHSPVKVGESPAEQFKKYVDTYVKDDLEPFIIDLFTTNILNSLKQ
jgi:hypothetical protein